MHRDDRADAAAHRHLHDLSDLPLDPDIDDVEDARHHPHPPGPPAPGPRWPRFRLRVLAAIYIGGVLGGISRYEIERVAPAGADRFPWATLAINTTGAFTLALLLVLVLEALRPRWYLRPGVGTGFLGAFTTFSSVVTSTDRFAAHGHPGLAAGYLIGSAVAGLLAAGLGLLAGRTIAARGTGRPAVMDESAA